MIYARFRALAARKRNYLQVCGVFMQISNSQGATRCTLSRGQIYISTSMPLHATRLVAFAVATLTPPSSRLSTLAKSRSSRCFTALSSIRPGSYAEPINSGRASSRRRRYRGCSRKMLSQVGSSRSSFSNRPISGYDLLRRNYSLSFN